MSFAIIDCNCDYLNLDPLVQSLKNESVTLIYQNDSQLEELVPDRDNGLGIYITNITDIAVSRQCNLIINSEKVKQWLIVIIDSQNSNQNERNVASSTYKSKFSKIDKDVLVLCGDAEEVSSQISPEIKKLRIMQRNVTLVSSASRDRSTEFAVKVLSELYPNISFELCPMSELAEKGKYARHIIIIGSRPDDFLVPLQDDAYFKLVLLFNNIEQAPVKLVNLQNTKESVISAMNKLGWELPLSFERFYAVSMAYERYYLDIKKGERTYNEFCSNRRFVMWDRYGLPCLAEDYTEEKIKKFFESICIADEIMT